MNTKTRDLVETSMLIALVFLFTRILSFKLPISVNGGLVHLGNVMAIIACLSFGKKKGAIASGFGMAIFDLLSGFPVWAPFTFVIRFLMAYILCFFSERKVFKSQAVANVIGVIMSGIFMIVGYYISEVIIYGNMAIPLTSVPGDILLVTIGGAIGLPVSAYINKHNIFARKETGKSYI